MWTPSQLLAALVVCILSRDVGGKSIDKDDRKEDIPTRPLIGLDKRRSDVLAVVLELLDAIDLPSLCQSMSATSMSLSNVDDIIARAAAVYDTMPSEYQRTDKLSRSLIPERLLKAGRPRLSLKTTFPEKNLHKSSSTSMDKEKKPQDPLQIFTDHKGIRVRSPLKGHPGSEQRHSTSEMSDYNSFFSDGKGVRSSYEEFPTTSNLPLPSRYFDYTLFHPTSDDDDDVYDPGTNLIANEASGSSHRSDASSSMGQGESIDSGRLLLPRDLTPLFSVGDMDDRDQVLIENNQTLKSDFEISTENLKTEVDDDDDDDEQKQLPENVEDAVVIKDTGNFTIGMSAFYKSSTSNGENSTVQNTPSFETVTEGLPSSNDSLLSVTADIPVTKELSSATKNTSASLNHTTITTAIPTPTDIGHVANDSGEAAARIPFNEDITIQNKTDITENNENMTNATVPSVLAPSFDMSLQAGNGSKDTGRPEAEGLISSNTTLHGGRVGQTSTTSTHISVSVNTLTQGSLAQSKNLNLTADDDKLQTQESSVRSEGRSSNSSFKNNSIPPDSSFEYTDTSAPSSFKPPGTTSSLDKKGTSESVDVQTKPLSNSTSSLAVNSSLDIDTHFDSLTENETTINTKNVDVYGDSLDSKMDTVFELNATDRNTNTMQADISTKPTSKTEVNIEGNTTTVLTSVNLTALWNFSVTRQDIVDTSVGTEAPSPRNMTQVLSDSESEGRPLQLSNRPTNSSARDVNTTWNASLIMIDSNSSTFLTMITPNTSTNSSPQLQDVGTEATDTMAITTSQSTTEGSELSTPFNISSRENETDTKRNNTLSDTVIPAVMEKEESYNISVDSPGGENSSTVTLNTTTTPTFEDSQTTRPPMDTTDTGKVSDISTLLTSPGLLITERPSTESTERVTPLSDTAQTTAQYHPSGPWSGSSQNRVMDTAEREYATDTYNSLERWRSMQSPLKKEQRSVKEQKSPNKAYATGPTAAQEDLSPWADRREENRQPQVVDSLTAAILSTTDLLRKQNDASGSGYYYNTGTMGTDKAALWQNYFSSSKDTGKIVKSGPSSERFPSMLALDVQRRADREHFRRRIHAQPFSELWQGYSSRRDTTYRPHFLQPDMWAQNSGHRQSVQNQAPPSLQLSDDLTPSSPYDDYYIDPDFKDFVSSDDRGSNSKSEQNEFGYVRKTDNFKVNDRTWETPRQEQPRPFTRTAPHDNFMAKSEMLKRPRHDQGDSWIEANPYDDFKTKGEMLKRLGNDQRGTWTEAAPYNTLKAKNDGLEQLRNDQRGAWIKTAPYDRYQAKSDGLEQLGNVQRGTWTDANSYDSFTTNTDALGRSNLDQRSHWTETSPYDSFKEKSEILGRLNYDQGNPWAKPSSYGDFPAKNEVLGYISPEQIAGWSWKALYGKLPARFEEGYACPGLFSLFGNTDDCHSFFICSWGVPYRFSCPTGTRWNPSRSVCDWSSDNACPN